MAIYVGEKNALLLKNDRSVVEFYKGNTKIFGYNNSKQGRVITADDVHPIEHKLKIKLSSDSVTDFSGVNVTRCGKNLFDKDEASVRSNWISHVGGYGVFKVFVGKGNTFTVSYQQDLVTGMACPYTMIACDLSNIDKNAGWLYHKTMAALINKKWTYTAIEDYIYVRSNIPSESSFANFMQYIGNDLQIEIGATATEHQPYKQPQTVTVKADGTVEGITGLPNMTILSDADGVVINCEYVKG